MVRGGQKRDLLGFLKLPGSTPLTVPANFCCDGSVEYFELSLTWKIHYSAPLYFTIGVWSNPDKVSFSRDRDRRHDQWCAGWRGQRCSRYLRGPTLTKRDLPLSVCTVQVLASKLSNTEYSSTLVLRGLKVGIEYVSSSYAKSWQ